VGGRTRREDKGRTVMTVDRTETVRTGWGTGNGELDGTLTGDENAMGTGGRRTQHRTARDGTEKIAEMGRAETGRNGLLAGQATGDGTG
jgi:hypothetical protein